MTQSVREIVKSIQAEVMESQDLLPDRAAELLAKSSAILGNCLDEIRKREGEYRVVLMFALESEKSAARAKIKAENDPTYGSLREAQDTKILILEMIRSLKFYLRAKEDEYRFSKHL